MTEPNNVKATYQAITDAERYANQMERQLEALEQKLDAFLAEFESSNEEDAKDMRSDAGNADGLESVGDGAEPVKEEDHIQGQRLRTANTSASGEVGSGDSAKEPASNGNTKKE
ncbi:hypothetical protein BJ508DRAFT_413488 [Ascobolus immersus RN42]|uniref:Uncharacterized protein n=1 Tax=Ascobolus immersus RN42 TaxID=1160509 RepID=A0A3N4IB31_ASCIM|nr:hypothetical protein BJ508DRAFT_413488 [Ascobolus immersus RN42]